MYICNICKLAAGGVPKASSDKSASTTESQCALSCNSNTGAGELYSGSCVYYGSITEDKNYRTENVEANGTAACEDLCNTLNLGPMSDFVNYAPNFCCACGGNLCYASADMKNNEKVVLAAVQQGGGNLCYASADMKNNEKVRDNWFRLPD